MTTPTLTVDFTREGATEILRSMIEPGPDEISVYGTRGDGKTTSVLGGMVAHAQRHQAEGYPLPTRWLGVADTFETHRSKTHDSLMDPLWGNCWRLEESGHVAVFREPGGVDMVRLRLTGVEDAEALARVRTQMHGLWFEEPAPASVLVASSGLTDAAWGMGITSCRLPTYRHPKIMTLNYPDEDHWTWQRFVVEGCPDGCSRNVDTLQGGTVVGGCQHRRYIRIRPMERATAEQHADWKRALSGRPDLLRRLLQGQPGTLMLGPQVAVGFTRDTHVRPVQPVSGAVVWMGLDFGSTPAAVICQRVGGYIQVIGALNCDTEKMGSEQFITHVVEPWLGDHTPWALGRVADDSFLRVIYDPSANKGAEGDIDVNALRIFKRRLPGTYLPGPMLWDPRRDAVLRAINSMVGGQPMLRIDPSCRGLIKALDGAWYYDMGPDGKLKKADGSSESVKPHKPNHPHEDYGDAFAYVMDGLRLNGSPRPEGYTPAPNKIAFNPYRYQQARGKAKTTFNPYRAIR
jgi:hypothetical protein